MSSQEQTTPSRPVLARKACVFCNSRKVKCDKSLPSCQRCRKLGLLCPGYTPSSQKSTTTPGSVGEGEDGIVEVAFRDAGLQRRRVGACGECRATKSKCDRARPQCQRCRTKSLSCVYKSASLKRPPLASGIHERPALTVDERQRLSSDFVSPGGTMQSAYPMVEDEDTGSEYGWLYSARLPGRQRMKSLAEAFFNHVHPLRSLGFLHKPTFMRSLDRGDLHEQYGDAVVYTICALGARFLDTTSMVSQEKEGGSWDDRTPGKAWGDQARDLARLNSCIPTIQNLMSLVLYCEYGLRIDDTAFVFMLTGCCCRMVRLLRLDSEQPNINTASMSPRELTKLETQRRLTWSCYILDSFVGSGVAGNLCWVSDAPPIPLPCREVEFLHQTASAPIFLELDKDPEGPVTSEPDVRGQAARLMFLRTQVLKCIRTPDNSSNSSSPKPWETGSEFLHLLSRLEDWRRYLPKHLTFDDMNIYIQKDQKGLGAFFFLHLVYHACIFDLTRVTLAGYNFPLSAALADAPSEFKAEHQQKCFYHADALSWTLQTGLGYGVESFEDHYTSTAAFESTKIQVMYFATLGKGDPGLYSKICANINTNLHVLTLNHRHPDMANVYLSALSPFLFHFGFADIAEHWKPFQKAVLLPSPATSAAESTPGSPQVQNQGETQGGGTEVVGPVEASFLNQIATFRLARLEIRMPERVNRLSRTTTAGARPGNQVRNYNEVTPSPNVGSGAGFPQMDTAATHDSREDDPMSGMSVDAPVLMQNYTQPTLPFVDDDYYLRMAEEISDYMTWDGNLQQ